MGRGWDVHPRPQWVSVRTLRASQGLGSLALGSAVETEALCGKRGRHHDLIRNSEPVDEAQASVSEGQGGWGVTSLLLLPELSLQTAAPPRHSLTVPGDTRAKQGVKIHHVTDGS